MPRHAALLTRRRMLLATAGLLGAGLTTRMMQLPANASGSVPGAGLTELALYTGWRRSWDIIVPLSTDRAFPRRALIYDRVAGEAKLLAIDAGGGFVELNVFTGWRTTWDVITPSGFPRQLGVNGLVLYDRQVGEISLQQIDQFGNVRPVRSYPNQRRTWSAFLPIGAGGLMAYDRLGGFATLFSIEANGSLQEIRSYNDWRMTWDLLTTGPFTSGNLRPQRAAGGSVVHQRRGRYHAVRELHHVAHNLELDPGQPLPRAGPERQRHRRPGALRPQFIRGGVHRHRPREHADLAVAHQHAARHGLDQRHRHRPGPAPVL